MQLVMLFRELLACYQVTFVAAAQIMFIMLHPLLVMKCVKA